MAQHRARTIARAPLNDQAAEPGPGVMSVTAGADPALTRAPPGEVTASAG
ncbi:MAG: hypothetical protein AVDCRST_MAG67-266 [uncultured Solirubrobacteraceae bacterium]|uniref:Uncharacterized protein n=1 Tax=uncultured Solirubrobacteraceae bacterium TaxID=1162706 RepID=A0A6J4RN09_9ACTN|nr:MAG: hypothetical protein AVDCRST_MAG67-266 [uncultured Solirubrobacteraceae bacterium]